MRLLLRRFSLAGFLLAVPLVATAGLTALPSSATAGPGASVTPTNCGTPGVEYLAIDAAPHTIDPGATVTVTVRDGTTSPCGNTKGGKDVDVYARRSGEAGFTKLGTVRLPVAERESNGTLTDKPDRTTDYALGPDGRQVVTVTVTSPAPSPAGTPVLDECVAFPVDLDPNTIIATGEADMTARGAPGTTVDVLAYTRPSTTYRVVRSAVADDAGFAHFTVRPPANTRFVSRRHDRCSGPPLGVENSSVVLNVRTALTITTHRNGTRDVTFTGDSLPARPGGLIVSLYRITEDGRQVLTSQVRASAVDGQWSVRRRFTGSGRFGFVARTGQDLQNAPGASNVRSTLIY